MALNFPLANSLPNLDILPPVMQHNPEEANAPNLPHEILEKVTMITQTLGIENPSLLPSPESNCNCLHCQIAKAMQMGLPLKEESEEEEIVTDADLSFRSWDVEQTGDNLFTITNPIDSAEQYSVFLWQPRELHLWTKTLRAYSRRAKILIKILVEKKPTS